MNLNGPKLWVIRLALAAYWDFDCLAKKSPCSVAREKTQLTAQGGDFRISPDLMSRDEF